MMMMIANNAIAAQSRFSGTLLTSYNPSTAEQVIPTGSTPQQDMPKTNQPNQNYNS